MAAYWGFRIASLLARLVPLRVAYGCGFAAGVITYYLWAGGRRRCIGNMLRVTGGDEAAARRLARSSFGNYGLYLVDFLRFDSRPRDELRDRIRYEDWDYLDGALTGNGLVFVTVHFGVWDLGAVALSEHGYRVSVIADTFDDPRLNELVFGSRRKLGMQVLPADRIGPRLVRALRRNEIIAALIDVPQPGRGVEVEFFGGTVAVPDAPARVALRTQASVVAATVPRLGTWSDRATPDLERVSYEPTGDTDHDVRALTQAIFTALEAMVRRHPEQWYIFRSLWVDETPAGRVA
ncbi:MAG: hypothetical protein F4Y98_06215 [Chloroflexi bacterium]|nr:hypothetical protein [Chloroflexota bacterium]